MVGWLVSETGREEIKSSKHIGVIQKAKTYIWKIKFNLIDYYIKPIFQKKKRRTSRIKVIMIITRIMYNIKSVYYIVQLLITILVKT